MIVEYEGYLLYFLVIASVIGQKSVCTLDTEFLDPWFTPLLGSDFYPAEP